MIYYIIYSLYVTLCITLYVSYITYIFQKDGWKRRIVGIPLAQKEINPEYLQRSTKDVCLLFHPSFARYVTPCFLTNFLLHKGRQYCFLEELLTLSRRYFPSWICVHALFGHAKIECELLALCRCLVLDA